MNQKHLIIGIIVTMVLLVVLMVLVIIFWCKPKSNNNLGSDPGEIIPSKIPHDMLIQKIEAYGMPSSAYVPGDYHVFVVTEDKKICWNNYGRGWESKDPRTLIAENEAYIEWLEEFVPHDDLSKCGITFGLNGVCHTYANRELLIGKEEVDVRKMEKYYVSTAIFGKFGFGLNQLKDLLRTSFYETRKKHLALADEQVLENVLKKVDNYLEDELLAWKELAKDFFDMPIDEIISKATIEDLDFVKVELQGLVNNREALYQELLDEKISVGEFKKSIRDLLDSKLTKQLDYLENKKYIGREEKKIYIKNIEDFLKVIHSSLEQQQISIQNTGMMNEFLTFE